MERVDLREDHDKIISAHARDAPSQAGFEQRSASRNATHLCFELGIADLELCKLCEDLGEHFGAAVCHLDLTCFNTESGAGDTDRWVRDGVECKKGKGSRVPPSSTLIYIYPLLPPARPPALVHLSPGPAPWHVARYR